MASSKERVRRYRERQRAAERQAAETAAREQQAELLAEFEGHLRFARRFSPITCEHYGDRVALIARALHARGFHLTTATTAQLLEAWPQNGGPRWHNGLRQALVAFYAFHSPHAEENPAEGIPRARAPQTAPRPYTAEERARYLTAARELGPRYYALACLGVFAGLRVHEAVKLAWGEVDRTLHVMGKGSKERVVPAHPTLVAALEVWRQDCPSETWVFPPKPESRRSGGQDRPCVPHTGWGWHREIAERAGVLTAGRHRDGFHRTRHTAATGVYRATRDLLVTQRFLGHTSPATTAIYALVEDEALEQAVEAMFLK